MGADRSGAARGGAALVLLLTLACASDLVAIEGGHRHRRHGYTIGDPGPAWQRFALEGAALAYRRAGSATMSLRSSCGRPVATPPVMARHLLIGVRPTALHAAGPVAVDGRGGWTQTFDTQQGGVSQRVKTVTLVARGCTFDWVLVTASSFGGVEPEFDGWWGSFRLVGEPASGGGPA